MIHSPLNGQARLPLGDRDFSFDPDTGHYEASAGAAAGFGLTSDPHGRWFANYNVSHLKLRVMPWRYLENRPWLPPFPTTVNISDHGESARIFPISPPETRPNHPEQAGHFTSASGMLFIPEGSFHKSLDNTVLNMDVVANLIHRDVIKPDGPIFRGCRHAGEHDHDFIASRDNHFRPTDIEFGPDGALYLLDMHRDVIEHPDYIPENFRKTLDLRSGEKQGRIYRITVKRKKYQREEPSLDSENPWSAETAHRQHIENDTAPDTSEMNSRKLWILDHLGQLTGAQLEAALGNPDPGIRENALGLSGQAQAEKILTLTEDENPRVRFAAALALGGIEHPQKIGQLAKLLARDVEEIWTRRAILTASDGVDLLLALPEKLRNHVAAEELAYCAAFSSSDASWLSNMQPTAALLSGLYSGWSASQQKPKDFIPILNEWASGASSETAAAFLDLLTWYQQPHPDRIKRLTIEAELAATNPKLPVIERLQPIALIGKAKSPELLALLASSEPSRIQQAALTALRESGHGDLGKEIIARWSSLSPLVRRQAIDILLSDQNYHQAILDGLEQEKVTLAELNLDLEQRRTLLRWSSAAIRARAEKLFPDEEYLNRKEIVTDWLAKLPEKGDPANGEIWFTALCSACHRAGELGFQVGPDLTSVGHRSVEDLATHILDPNMAINPKYISTTVETEKGQRHTGLLVADDEQGVTLLLPAATRLAIPRGEIKSIRTESRSLMPEGLEAALDAKKLRDLIAFLQAKH